MSDGYCMTMTTVGDPQDASTLARAIVEARLAGCVQVTAAHSVYRWSGVVEEADEQLLLIKTTAASGRALEAFIAERHPYDLPELVTVPITGGSAAYLAWVDENTGSEPV